MGLALAASFALSCADKDDSGNAVDDDGGGSSTTDVATSGTSDPSEGTGSGTTTGDPAARTPAHGIRVSWVEANQGIGVKIGEGGEWVGPEGRSAFLLQNRVALIRAFWGLDADFEPREILAELTLEFPDGTTTVLQDQKLVDDDSFIGDLSKSFFWGVMPEQAVPGLLYRVDLYEVEDGYEDAPNPSQGLPRDGSNVLVGIESAELRLDIVIVPFNYNDGAGCNTQPDTSEETMQLFYDLMYMMNPVDQLNITLHDALDWNEELTDFNQLNSLMSDLRFEEGAADGVYYYGLIDACSGGVGEAGGKAYGIPSIPPERMQAYQRVSSGLSLDPDWSAETFVHEVGHSQGRRHVACSGEGGPDPTYPIEGGDVGEWGFGVIDFGLRHPTVHKDYMTYCHPAWVSTWGWNKVYPVISEISGWYEEDGAGAPAPEGPASAGLLVGTIAADGSEIWHTVPGFVSPDELTDGTRVEFSVAGQSIELTGAKVSEFQDGGGQMIVAPLPVGFDAVDGITLRREGELRQLDRTQMRLRHWAH